MERKPPTPPSEVAELFARGPRVAMARLRGVLAGHPRVKLWSPLTGKPQRPTRLYALLRVFAGSAEFTVTAVRDLAGSFPDVRFGVVYQNTVEFFGGEVSR